MLINETFEKWNKIVSAKVIIFTAFENYRHPGTILLNEFKSILKIIKQRNIEP